MNEVLGDIEDFDECCAQQRWFVDEGWVTKHVAVDNLQLLAESDGYVDQLGQDEVQRIMAEAFAPGGVLHPLSLPTDHAAQMLRQWELADPRDRWRHTGELPPPANVRNGDIGATEPEPRG